MAATRTGEDCVLGARHEAEIQQLQVSDKDQWTAINALRNRLPHWATVAISLLTLLVGWLLAAARGHGG